MSASGQMQVLVIAQYPLVERPLSEGNAGMFNALARL